MSDLDTGYMVKWRLPRQTPHKYRCESDSNPLCGGLQCSAITTVSSEDPFQRTDIEKYMFTFNQEPTDTCLIHHSLACYIFSVKSFFGVIASTYTASFIHNLIIVNKYKMSRMVLKLHFSSLDFLNPLLPIRVIK